jgi:hypothetical protein
MLISQACNSWSPRLKLRAQIQPIWCWRNKLENKLVLKICQSKRNNNKKIRIKYDRKKKLKDDEIIKKNQL